MRASEIAKRQADIDAGEARAFGVARECFEEFKASRGRRSLAEHHDLRLERMLSIAQAEVMERFEKFNGPFSWLPRCIQGEVRTSLCIALDHAIHIKGLIQNELNKRRKEAEEKRRWQKQSRRSASFTRR